MRQTISLDVQEPETQAYIEDEDGQVVAEKRFLSFSSSGSNRATVQSERGAY
jgi:t-SNARE complex subunit (syntaxin)